jgi:hypothetical protein
MRRAVLIVVMLLTVLAAQFGEPSTSAPKSGHTWFDAVLWAVLAIAIATVCAFAVGTTNSVTKKGYTRVGSYDVCLQCHPHGLDEAEAAAKAKASGTGVYAAVSDQGKALPTSSRIAHLDGHAKRQRSVSAETSSQPTPASPGNAQGIASFFNTRSGLSGYQERLVLALTMNCLPFTVIENHAFLSLFGPFMEANKIRVGRNTAVAWTKSVAHRAHTL